MATGHSFFVLSGEREKIDLSLSLSLSRKELVVFSKNFFTSIYRKVPARIQASAKQKRYITH